MCNTGDGATWHPAAGLYFFSFFFFFLLFLTSKTQKQINKITKGTDYPKEKRVTSIRIPDIPASRLLDETVWYLLLKIALVKHKSHTPAQLYEVYKAYNNNNTITTKTTTIITTITKNHNNNTTNTLIFIFLYLRSFFLILLVPPLSIYF